MKSIKIKLITLFGVLVSGICISMAGISYVNARNALISNISLTFPKMAEDVAKTFETNLIDDIEDLDLVSRSPIVSDPSRTIEERLEFAVDQIKEDSNIISNGIIDSEKNYLSTDDGSLSDFEDNYFFDAMYEAGAAISDPILNKKTNELVVIYSLQIKHNDEVSGLLIQVRKATTFSDYIDYFSLGESGKAFLIQNDGTSLANRNTDLVLNRDNAIERSKEDPSLERLAEIQKKMINGETGLDKYQYGDDHFYVGYAPVPSTDWSSGIIINEDELLSELNDIKKYSVIGVILFTVLGNLIVFGFASLITKRIKSASNHLLNLANGDFSVVAQEEDIKSDDEISEMTKSMIKMQESLKEMIGTIRYNSEEIDNQSENLSSISEEIANSSQSISEVISDVTHGTGNQAENIIHIENILNSFNEKLSSMVNEVQVVDVNSREIGKMASGSSKEMDQVNSSVCEISDSFKEFYNKVISLGKDVNEINEITSLINSISDQTNLLALNAAIEATRAGEAGKGFSIVADEIRELAEQTKTSSENISNLIESVSKNTEEIVKESISIDDKLMKQAGNINNSINSFVKIIDGVDEIIPKIERVKNSAEDINRDKDNILNKIETLSSTATEISSSSEEISAASQEMSATTQEVAGSAQILNRMTAEMIEEVNKFKL